MDKQKKFFGIKHALEGIYSFFRCELNAKIHLLSALFVVFLGLFFNVTKFEWLWLLASISLVFITEMLNSAIEILCDLVTPDYHEKAKRLKDISAGAVLIAALFALAVGISVFWTYIASYFN